MYVRECASCQDTKSLSGEYSITQWRKGPGVSRCTECVRSRKLPTARCNHSSKAIVDYSSLHAVGAFRDVYKGHYTDGINAGKVCVVKHFRDKHLEDKWFTWDQKVVEKATQIASDWNANFSDLGGTIQVNQPNSFSNPEHGRALMEPFINTYTKFNSNTGHVFPSKYSDMMQALSHFSYHNSCGEYVLCDLQGGSHGSGSVILTDPAILSRDKSFGPTDLGYPGIIQFFSQHRCNQWCKGHWQLPNIPPGHRASNAIAGTTIQCDATTCDVVEDRNAKRRRLNEKEELFAQAFTLFLELRGMLQRM